MEILGNNLVAKSGKKVANNYYCEKCDYQCCKIYNWNKHIGTAKHNKEIIVHNLVAKNGEKWQNYLCEKCEKCFQTNAGLWKHKTKGKCIKLNNIIEDKNEVIDLYKNTISNKDELIITLLKQNAELIKGQQDMMIKLSENGINNSNSNNNNNTNSHNKTFNLQFFLNETCKDAMNIMDFVDSIKIQLSDLEKVGKIGYVEGISNIIVKNLNLLDETKRPVHCTDSKREVMYVKDDNKWEKENETNQKIRKAIKKVAHKNSKMLSEFRVKNPDCLKSTSKVSDQYNKLVFEALGGKGDNDLEKEDKIIKNIAKEVTIDSKS
jgi:hypothetical protein